MSANPVSQKAGASEWPLRSLAVSAAGFLIGLFSGIILAIFNVLAPQWINRPEISAKFVQAFPIAAYKQIDDALFSQFISQVPKSVVSGSDPSCFQQLMLNKISPKCKTDVAEILDDMVSSEERLGVVYSQYLDNIAKLDIHQVSSLPRLKEGGDLLNQPIDLFNSFIGILRAMPTEGGDSDRAAAALEHYFEQSRDRLMEEAEGRKSYISVLKKVRDEFESLNLDRERGIRTGVVYFRIGIQNIGTADGLVSPNATLVFSQNELRLVPLGDPHRYMIVSKGTMVPGSKLMKRIHLTGL